MNAKYTPGPWIDDGHDGKDTQIVNSKWGEVAKVVYNGDCSQRVANARLIAAAPELLEALQWAADFAEGSRDANEKLNNPKFNEWLGKCRSAIAKATGES